MYQSFSITKKSKILSNNLDDISVRIKIKINHLRVPISFTKTFLDNEEEDRTEWHGYKECFDDENNLFYQCFSRNNYQTFAKIGRINEIFNLYLTQIDLIGHNHKEHFSLYATKSFNINLPRQLKINDFNSYDGYTLSLEQKYNNFFTDVPDDISETLEINKEGDITERNYTRNILNNDRSCTYQSLGNTF